ncbi:MAG TPA: hypothetical protein VJT75_01775 [Thermoleophilaceae bacterium]|nr:hypothetical protein [Thermoleophilaceae bacterium]
MAAGPLRRARARAKGRRDSARLAAVIAGGFGPVFALPLLLHPYRWARAFGWRAEPETDVGLYFGRCLGALATASCVQAARASRDPARHASYYEFAEVAGWLLAAVHLRGLLERRQPPIEHAEIAGYSAFALAARRYSPDR